MYFYIDTLVSIPIYSLCRQQHQSILKEWISMKALMGILIVLTAQGALALPWFHAGTYECQGNGFDENNNPMQYEVTSVFSDSDNEVSTYKVAGGIDQYTIQLNGNT